jgi:hypothetical protein
MAMSFMLSVTNKPFTLSVVMLNVLMQSVVMLRVVAPVGQTSANRTKAGLSFQLKMWLYVCYLLSEHCKETA